MGSVELFIILAVTALHFSIVSWGVRPDELVSDAKALKLFFKECRFITPPWEQSVGEFSAVVRLDALDGKGELFDHMSQENSGGIGAVFLEGFYITEAAEFIQKGILIPLGRFWLADNAGLRHEFHIDLHPLAGILHLFVGFRRILGVWQFDGHSPSFPQEAV